MAKLKLGVQLYSVRHYVEKDMPGTLKKMAQIGYEGVEFYGGFFWPADEVKKAADDAGLAVTGWHVPFTAIDKPQIYATIEYAKKIGMKTICVPGLPAEMTCSADAWRETAKKFSEAAAILAKAGITLGYHNHSAEFKAIDGDDCAWDVFMKNTCPCVMGQIDNGNALSGGGDALAMLKKYPGRAVTWHIKPYSLKDGFATMIGEDSIDWKATFDEIIAQNATQWNIVEYECAEKYDEIEGVRLCCERIREMGY